MGHSSLNSFPRFVYFFNGPKTTGSVHGDYIDAFWCYKVTCEGLTLPSDAMISKREHKGHYIYISPAYWVWLERVTWLDGGKGQWKGLLLLTGLDKETLLSPFFDLLPDWSLEPFSFSAFLSALICIKIHVTMII